MRISHKYKFVFISNPKCASVSIRTFLDEYSDIISNNGVGEDSGSPFYHHANAEQLFNHFQKEGWAWEEYFKFSTIRNPWARVISQYFFSQPDIHGIGRSDPGYIPETKFGISFHKWVMSEDNKNIRDLHSESILCRYGCKDILVDRIIKSEELDVEMPKICKQIGIPYRPIKVLNSTAHRHYTRYYTTQSIQRVRELFAFDIELGNYQFGMD